MSTEGDAVFSSSHAKMHQAENQALRGEQQLPWRRGVLGWVIPLTTVAVAGIVVLVVVLTS